MHDDQEEVGGEDEEEGVAARAQGGRVRVREHGAVVVPCPGEVEGGVGPPEPGLAERRPEPLDVASVAAAV